VNAGTVGVAEFVQQKVVDVGQRIDANELNRVVPRAHALGGNGTRADVEHSQRHPGTHPQFRGQVGWIGRMAQFAITGFAPGGEFLVTEPAAPEGHFVMDVASPGVELAGGELLVTHGDAQS